EQKRLKELRKAETVADQKLKAAASTPEFAQALADWEKNLAAEKTNWETLDPSEFTSEGGATLRKNNTRSIIAEDRNPSNDTYVVTATVDSGRFTGVRLEVLETGSEKDLGRGVDGGFVLRKFDLAVRPAGSEGARSEIWKAVSADFSQKDFGVEN